MKSLEQMTDEELDQAILEKAGAQVQEMDYSSLSDEDLDNMLTEKIMAEQEGPQSRPGEAFAQGFGNAASFGYLPQIQAATEPLADKISSLFADDADAKLKEQGFTIEEAPEESYVQRRDKFIRKGQKLAEENPVASGVGGATGAIVSGIATGGGLSKLLGTAGKAVTMGKRLGDAAKTGATIGALRNPGDTEGEVDVLQLKDRAGNAVKDAVTGAVVQGGMEIARKAGEGVKGAGKNLKNWSQRKALRAAGAEKTQFKKQILNKKDKVLGQAVLDNKLINAGDDARDIAKNAEKALAESQGKLNKVYEEADNAGMLGLRKEDVKAIADDYMDDAANRLDGTVDGEDIAAKISKVIETIPKNATFSQLRKWRASIDDQINFSKANNDLPKYQEELLHLRNKVQERLSQQMGKTSPELKQRFLRENKQVSELSEIKKIAEQKSAGIEGNTSFGIREGFGATIGGMIGGAVAGPVGVPAGAALAAVTTNYARKHATPFVAMTANKVARALEKNQDAIGKFSKPLIEAAKSPEKFVAAINLMMKDPEFKRKIKTIDQDLPVYRGPAKGPKK